MAGFSKKTVNAIQAHMTQQGILVQSFVLTVLQNPEASGLIRQRIHEEVDAMLDVIIEAKLHGE